VRCEPERLALSIVAWPGFCARRVTPGAALEALRVTLPYVPLAKQITEPAAAEETADCAAEVLEAVLVHWLGGVTGGSFSLGGGVTALTVQLRAAGVESTLPARSLARTVKRCEPRASPE
jgi:hypothetical protein